MKILGLGDSNQGLRDTQYALAWGYILDGVHTKTPIVEPEEKQWCNLIRQKFDMCSTLCEILKASSLSEVVYFTCNIARNNKNMPCNYLNFEYSILAFIDSRNFIFIRFIK